MEKTNKINAEMLTGLLLEMNLPASFIKKEISPTNELYHFDLHKPLDYGKVGKVTKCLAAAIHKKAKNTDSDIASFCLSIPRDERAFPAFKEYHNVLKGAQAGEILFGINERGKPVTKNIRKTKSILIGGASGGGKSVYLSGIIASLLCYSKPEECGLALVDLKRCEFELFKNSKHLVAPVQFDYEGAFDLICEVKREIEDRYISMQEEGIRKAEVDKYPILILVIDEYAELARQSDKKELEDMISSIASTGRACNVFVILATQHAVSSIVSNAIKSNLQTRIGLRTTNIAQSACIIGSKDCNDLLGYGDSYILFDGAAGLERVQGCFISEDEINLILAEANEAAKQAQANETKTKTRTRSPFLSGLKRLFGKIDKLQGKAPKRGLKPFKTQELNYIDCCIDDDLDLE